MYLCIYIGVCFNDRKAVELQELQALKDLNRWISIYLGVKIKLGNTKLYYVVQDFYKV